MSKTTDIVPLRPRAVAVSSLPLRRGADVRIAAFKSAFGALKGARAKEMLKEVARGRAEWERRLKKFDHTLLDTRLKKEVQMWDDASANDLRAFNAKHSL